MRHTQNYSQHTCQSLSQVYVSVFISALTWLLSKQSCLFLICSFFAVWIFPCRRNSGKSHSSAYVRSRCLANVCVAGNHGILHQTFLPPSSRSWFVVFGTNLAFCRWSLGDLASVTIVPRMPIVIAKQFFHWFRITYNWRSSAKGKALALRVAPVRLCTRGAVFGAQLVVNARSASDPLMSAILLIAATAGALAFITKTWVPAVLFTESGFACSCQVRYGPPHQGYIAAHCQAPLAPRILLSIVDRRSTKFLQLFVSGCHRHACVRRS